MYRRWKALFMAMLLLVITVLGPLEPVHMAKAAEELTVNIHYHRYADDYEGWNIWSWIGSGEGASYEFQGEDDFGKVASYTLQIEEGTTEVGFIVRHSTESNAWNLKDTNNDRFIDITKAKEGVIDIYVVQDDSNFGYQENEMNLEPKILAATIESASTIDFKVTTAFDSTANDMTSKIEVKDEEGKTYEVGGISSPGQASATTATITMAQELDLFKKYILVIDGYGEMAITNTKLFSTKEFEEAYYYEGNDLGAIWSKEKTAFRLWAPTASEVILNMYSAGVGINLTQSVPMKQDVKGTWYLEMMGDLNGTYYTYSVTVDEVTKEAVDPYARTTGVNGDRGMVVDLESTNPEGFDADVRPEFLNPTDAVIYELHIRDFSVDKSSGMKNKGKYLAFTEKGTKSTTGEKTGIDYLVDLGVTHVHLLPSFDYATVDETKLVNNEFNWGYDPENYNVPEGSYSTDPHHGEVRINEYKQMVQSLHNNGLRVIMDVVYNHTSSVDSNLNKVVPGYYYRLNDDGSYSNASGCGNETASERAMMRKYIVDSVVYWATEYHVDGFRFDLMGIHDVDTMNAIREALNEVDPTIIVYGEGWTASSSPLPIEQQALKANVPLLDTKIAAFSDDIRDGLKGSVFDAMDRGFISGKAGMEESIKFGVVASTEHSQIDYSLVNYSDTWWAKEPTQTINYASAHDNNTLWDKITITNAEDSIEDRTKMNLLSAAIVLTSQGIPFFQAGEEFLRSKPADEIGTTFVDNSYKSSDFVNSLKWSTLTENKEVYDYYKGLIAFRKEHSALRMTTTAEIQSNLKFLEGLEKNVVGYVINNSPNNENAKAICVIYNANKTATSVSVPEGEWNVYVKDNQAGTKIIETVSNDTVSVNPISTLVLVQEDVKEAISTDNSIDLDQDASAPAIDGWQKTNTMLYVLLGIVAVAVAAIGFIVVRNRKKK